MPRNRDNKSHGQRRFRDSDDDGRSGKKSRRDHLSRDLMDALQQDERRMDEQRFARDMGVDF